MTTPRAYFGRMCAADRNALLDEHRDINVHDYWWDSTYDNFKRDMAEIGIEVRNIYFSGFWSQGDGACFEGEVCDWGPFLKSRGYNDAALITHAEQHFQFSVTHHGHYYHENCTSFAVHLPLPEHDEDSYFLDDYSPHERDSLHEAVWMVGINKYSFEAMERDFTEAFKGHMRDLYTALNKEYDYLTSDEAVLDSLEANDMLEDAIESITTENENA